jgi:hypothetical protein
MSPLNKMSRWNRRSTLGPGASTHLGVCPPSLRQAPDSPWRRMLFWLLAPAPADAAPPTNRLPAVRVEFMRAMADVDGHDADNLRNRIALARSLRELWHLRSDVFRVIGLAYSQREAEGRLALLNRHFPARAPRSQFGTF